MSSDLPPDDYPLGEAWHQAIAMVLVILVDSLEHKGANLTGTSRHGSPDHLLQATISDLRRLFPLDSPYAAEVQSHIADILNLYLTFRRRLPPP